MARWDLVPGLKADFASSRMNPHSRSRTSSNTSRTSSSPLLNPHLSFHLTHALFPHVHLRRPRQYQPRKPSILDCSGHDPARHHLVRHPLQRLPPLRALRPMFSPGPRYVQGRLRRQNASLPALPRHSWTECKSQNISVEDFHIVYNSPLCGRSSTAARLVWLIFIALEVGTDATSVIDSV